MGQRTTTRGGRLGEDASGTDPTGTPALPGAAAAGVDYRRTAVGRRRSWYGAKRHVKRVLGWRLPNLAMRGAVRVAAPRLRATGRLPVPAAVPEVVGRVDGAEYAMLSPARCVVAKELYWGDGRRPHPADDLAVQLFARAARSAGAMFDIGAYTGLFTLVGTAVNPDLRAHAFEIVPEVFHTLFDNCVRNRVLHRTTLHHVGVGDPDTLVRMPARSGDSALPCFYSSALTFADGVPVGVVALDDFTDHVARGTRVLLKVDVEGTEDAVFAHGQDFLAAHRPDILCEVLPEADGRRLRALLEPLGYRFHLVGERALAPAGQLDPHARFRDWFFTTRDTGELELLGIPVS
ncbi:FkbM family methyltransferase [Marinitenerispora sediminis]|uniref:FkbM family methyltransferase n=2 Tax=Marinitenerispora sediminis TaxID=1931232 RepID=A0A368T5Q3_9ACTN|nr:FkbM family methyltransferase [Marinitenerispora sediminis]RCV53316.1 FkbM family methyltransferase [Marinitenerispora sediminis]RCV58547.1 FkbM family methyltransferase [Marinitenerispora sediminis]RCV58870.1 FkbM family methyltransferase [Marinitenerispora sediminis]